MTVIKRQKDEDWANDLIWYCAEGKDLPVNMKRCSTTLIIGQIQSKIMK